MRERPAQQQTVALGEPAAELLRHRDGAVAVAAAEQSSVYQQRMQLVQPAAIPPAVGKRERLLVGADDGLELCQPEQVEHREIRLAVAAMGSRVDQPRL